MTEQNRLYELSKATMGEEVELAIFGRQTKIYLPMREPEKPQREDAQNNTNVKGGKDD